MMCDEPVTRGDPIVGWRSPGTDVSPRRSEHSALNDFSLAQQSLASQSQPPWDPTCSWGGVLDDRLFAVPALLRRRLYHLGQQIATASSLNRAFQYFSNIVEYAIGMMCSAIATCF